jgi:hypothetical protein
MKSLRPFLLEGTLTIPPTGLERVHAGIFEHDGQVVVVVLSTHRETSFPVSIPLPAAAYDSLQPMFPRRSESGMTLDGGNLVGTITCANRIPASSPRICVRCATRPGNCHASRKR